MKLYQQMIKDLRTSQKSNQLVLILTVLLCHARLLSYTSNNTVKLIRDCYLIDLNALLNDHSLSNRRMIFEKMSSALLFILYIFEDEYRNMIQLLVIVLDNTALIVESFDASTKLYFTGRIVDLLTHNSAFKAVSFLLLTKSMSELNMNDEE